VLHKCANPACASPFRKLSQGKLFLVEMEPIERSQSRRPHGRSQPSHRIEYYWLCDQCALAMTLSYEQGRGVVAVVKAEFAKKLPAAAAHAVEMPYNATSRSEQSA
jgi:hypothetical protein